MAKETNETKDKLDKLEKVLEDFSREETIEETKTEEVVNKAPKTKKGKLYFRTSEVVILLLITLVTSLLMGGFVSYKVLITNTEKLDSELKEFINNYEYITDNYNGKIDKKKLIDAAIEGMLEKLDKNSVYLDSDSSKNFNTMLDGSYNGLGIQIYKQEDKIIIYSVFEGSPADKAGLKEGDIIKKINNKSVDGLKSSDVVKLVKKNSKKPITLVYEREGVEKTAKINVGEVNLKSVDSETFEKNGKNIGYIGIGIFASNSYKQFKEELKKVENKDIDALVIDLRGNSGGYLYVAENIISLFLDTSHIIYQIQKDGDTTKHYSKGLSTKKYKVAILVDGNSASASEVLASALQEQYGAVLVGTKTYGKGSVQELQDLTDGNKYKLTTKNWLTSKGAWVEGKGIEPDVNVELDEKYFDDPKEDNDNQLQTAIGELTK